MVDLSKDTLTQHPFLLWKAETWQQYQKTESQEESQESQEEKLRNEFLYFLCDSFI